MMDTQEVVILDVREQHEYDSGHISGAVLLPVGTITKDTAAAVIDNLDAVVLVGDELLDAGFYHFYVKARILCN